jgi:hypothetical protein
MSPFASAGSFGILFPWAEILAPEEFDFNPSDGAEIAVQLVIELNGLCMILFETGNVLTWETLFHSKGLFEVCELRVYDLKQSEMTDADDLLA